jgi:hypothetical protein
MIEAVKADDATLMRIYKDGLTHTLESALRAVYEQGLHDAIKAEADAKVPAATPAAAPAVAPVRPAVHPAAHLTPSPKGPGTK